MDGRSVKKKKHLFVSLLTDNRENQFIIEDMSPLPPQACDKCMKKITRKKNNTCFLYET